MNILSFSMPLSAYMNPLSFGDFTGINKIIYSLSHLFADQKFMSLFSILFGAGVCLFSERAIAKTGKSAGLHYRRNFWLLLFGMIHAYFIWYGDILVAYAVSSFVVFLFRNKTPRTLYIVAVVFLSLPSLYSLFVQFALDNQLIPDNELVGIKSIWAPSAESLSTFIAAYQGGLDQYHPIRVSETILMQTQVLLSTMFWRAAGMMMIGMALYKSGILTGKKSSTYYLKLTLIGVLIGTLLTGYGMFKNMEHGYAFEYSMFLGSQFNYWGSIFTCLGYVGLINLVIQKDLFVSLQRRLAKVGQMAFTNYISHSIICTFIFYGTGLGYFGEVERWGLILIVLAIWGLQLWLSTVWLARHRFGPLEWCWRSLTYWQSQPLRIKD